MSVDSGFAGRLAFEACLDPEGDGAPGHVTGDASEDILSRPLGLEPPKPGKLRALRVDPRILAAVLGGSVLALCAVVAVMGDPQGGQPQANAVIAMREASPAPSTPLRSGTPETVAPAPNKASGQRDSAAAIETASGVTVTRPAGTTAPQEAVIIRVPAPDVVRLAPAPDPRLVERGRHGPMPRIGEGRLRALDVYARPDEGGASPGGARIAILVSGLGIGQAATAAAIARLPPAISLALAPYAADLDKTAARARDAGHEILLQMPMEPFDYPDSDPGPQTLLAASRPAENLDRLAWAMSRVPGLVGVVNFMGGKLMSDGTALEPVLKEIGARGLGFVDDGAAQGSQAAAVALKLKVPATRAANVVDAVMRPDAIDRELARLEAQAKASGFVLASASSQQMTIDRLARWARDLEARGIRLVPVSVALRGQPAGETAGPSRTARASTPEH